MYGEKLDELIQEMGWNCWGEFVPFHTQMLVSEPSLILTGTRPVVGKGKESGRVFNLGRRGLFLATEGERIIMRLKVGGAATVTDDGEVSDSQAAILIPLHPCCSSHSTYLS